MRKPDSLREWLLRSVPGLDTAPERLHLFIENGFIRAVKGETLSYAYHYELVVLLEDFASQSHSLFVPLIAWIAEHQPDLIGAENELGLPISQDILGNDTCDFEIKLALYEQVVVTQTPEGGWSVAYPVPAPFPEIFEGAGAARLWRLYFDRGTVRDLVAVHPDHLP